MSTPENSFKSSAPDLASWPKVALAAWLVPGLGHWLMGDVRRGLIVGITLMALFAGGLLVGGIDVIDYREDPLWFAGQMLVGPTAIGLGWWHARMDDAAEPDPDADPAYRRSIGRVNEMGTLYCTLAGVLNLLVILDAVSRVSGEKRS